MTEIKISLGLRPSDARKLKKIDQLMGATKQGIRRANYLIGKELTKVAKTKILKGPKTGRIYMLARASGRIVRHQSSAPGQPPANFSGALRASVGFVVKGQQLHFGAGGTVESGRLKGKNVLYARPLELGSTKRKLLKRPYLKAAINDSSKIVTNYYEQYIRESIDKTIKDKGLGVKTI